jgi:hypothetical protein
MREVLQAFVIGATGLAVYAVVFNWGAISTLGITVLKSARGACRASRQAPYAIGECFYRNISKRVQEIDHILLLLVCEADAEASVVKVDDVENGCR